MTVSKLDDINPVTVKQYHLEYLKSTNSLETQRNLTQKLNCKRKILITQNDGQCLSRQIAPQSQNGILDFYQISAH